MVAGRSDEKVESFDRKPALEENSPQQLVFAKRMQLYK